MIDHELTDPTGSALTITHNVDGVWVTATDTRDEVTVGPFPPRALRASFDMGDDLMHGGVTAAAIENEAETLDAKASRLAAFGRSLGYPPEWTNAPAVVAWHRSDHRTEHDGTPGNPRIWSPGYRTTERWSTPSLRNVHWSDLVDVTPLAAIEAEVVSPELARSLVQENDELRARIGRVEEARDLYRRDVMTAERREQEASNRADEADKRAATASPRHITAREHLDAAWEAAHVPAAGCIPAGADYLWRNTASGRICQGIPDDEDGSAGVHGGLVERRLLDPEPPSRPEGAEEIEEALRYVHNNTEVHVANHAGLANALAERGVRVTAAES